MNTYLVSLAAAVVLTVGNIQAGIIKPTPLEVNNTIHIRAVSVFSDPSPGNEHKVHEYPDVNKLILADLGFAGRQMGQLFDAKQPGGRTCRPFARMMEIDNEGEKTKVTFESNLPTLMMKSIFQETPRKSLIRFRLTNKNRTPNLVDMTEVLDKFFSCVNSLAAEGHMVEGLTVKDMTRLRQFSDNEFVGPDNFKKIFENLENLEYLEEKLPEAWTPFKVLALNILDHEDLHDRHLALAMIDSMENEKYLYPLEKKVVYQRPPSPQYRRLMRRLKEIWEYKQIFMFLVTRMMPSRQPQYVDYPFSRQIPTFLVRDEQEFKIASTELAQALKPRNPSNMHYQCHPLQDPAGVALVADNELVLSSLLGDLPIHQQCECMELFMSHSAKDGRLGPKTSKYFKDLDCDQDEY